MRAWASSGRRAGALRRRAIVALALLGALAVPSRADVGVAGGVTVDAIRAPRAIGASVRMGVAPSDWLELRLGGDLTTRDGRASAGVAFLDRDKPRLTLGLGVAGGAWRDAARGRGGFGELGPLFVWHPTWMPERPVCNGCPVDEDRTPVQVEFEPFTIRVESDGRLAFAAAVRIGVRH